MLDAPRPCGGIDQSGRRAHRVADDAHGLQRRELLADLVQIGDVLDEMVETAGADPLRIAVAAKVERDRPARNERREQIERMRVVEPAVQQHGRPALTALDCMQFQTSDIEEHPRSLTA